MDDEFPVPITLPRGFARSIVTFGWEPVIERDDTHLELLLAADGGVTWRMVRTSTGEMMLP